MKWILVPRLTSLVFPKGHTATVIFGHLNDVFEGLGREDFLSRGQDV